MRLASIEAAADQAIAAAMNAALIATLRAAVDQGEPCSGLVIDAFHRRLGAELRWCRRSWAAESWTRPRVLLNALGPRASNLVDAELFADCEAGRRPVPRYVLLALEHLAIQRRMMERRTSHRRGN